MTAKVKNKYAYQVPQGYVLSSGLIRLYPNKHIQTKFYQNFGSTRFVFNQYKACFDKRYSNNPKLKFPNKTLLYKILVLLKQDYTWLTRADSTALQVAIDNYRQAMWRHIKHMSGLSRFKARHYYRQTYSTKNNNNSIRILDNHHIVLPKVGIVKCRNASSYKNLVIKRATITWREDLDKFWVALAGIRKAPKKPAKTHKSIGIDVGLGNEWIVTSDQRKNIISRWQVPKTKDLQNLERKWQSITDKRRHLAKIKTNFYNHKHKSTKIDEYNFQNWQRARKTKSKLARHISNIRKEQIYQVVNYLVKRYDVIVLEDLHVSNMLANHKLAKTISNASWYKFRQILAYKCQWLGKKLVLVNPAYTSRVCSNCHRLNPSFKHIKTNKWLAVRQWTCPFCSVTHDRDVNAAQNILNRGIQKLVK